MPDSARDEERVTRGVNRKQLCQTVQWMWREQPREQKAALPDSARDEERAANTIRREQKAALPDSARDV